MIHRFRRGVVAISLIAGAATTATLVEVSSASALAVPFTLSTGGSTGRVAVDALYGSNGCTSNNPPNDGSGYDAAWEYDINGNLTNSPGYSAPPNSVPTNGAGCPGTPEVSVLRLEIYPKPDSITLYDPWSGNFGGANSQRSRAIDGVNFANFGTVPIPTKDVVPPGGAYPGFRITGNIITSVGGTIPDNRVITDLFQVPCSAPDVCVLPPRTATGAYVGAFTTGKSKGSQWTGSIGWPGRYQVYVKDCPSPLGWNASNQCLDAGGAPVGTREVLGFVDISAGNVPTWDLDAPCFGIYNCQYLKGGLTTPTGGFHPLPPTRILDTRFNVGITGAIASGDGRLPTNYNPVHRLAATANHEIKVTGLGGVPAYGVSAVLLNVTAVFPGSDGWLSVFPRPASTDIYNNQGIYWADPPATTSNLNLTIGENVPNLVLARVGAGGTIRFWNATFAGLHVIADIAGWFDTSATTTPTPVLRFTGVQPDRLMDTRPGNGDPLGRFQPGHDRELKVTDIVLRSGQSIPADAQSVVVNITAAGPTKIGYVTAYPNGTTVPNASNVNVVPGVTRSNFAVVKVGTDGKIRLAVFETDMDLIVDIFGYYSLSGGLTTVINPVRLVDSRNGTGTPAGVFTPGQQRTIKVAGAAGIPSNATAVILNVTAAETTAWGYLTVWPGGPMPASSNLNWPGGKNTPNMVIVGINPSGGTIEIFNALGNTSVIVDVFGYVV